MRSMDVDPIVTYVLIAINVLMFLGAGAGGSILTGGGSGGSRVFNDFALWGPAIDLGHDYWRLITSGFLHSGILHIAFNMYILWWVGQMLEPALGHVRFTALYFASLLAGRVRRAAVLAERGHGRRLGRGLRPDGRGVRAPARARDRPDGSRASGRSSSSTWCSAS